MVEICFIDINGTMCQYEREVSVGLDNGYIENLKLSKIEDIVTYDSSDAVNSFTYQGVTMWIPKELRISLMNSSSIEAASGKTETTLWYGGVRFVLPIATLQQLLAAIELYALECYNVTESHKAAISAMTDINEVMAYEYKQGYPEKLAF